MVNVVEIRFKKAGKAYSFDVAGLEMTPGQSVVTETTRGLEVGLVISGPKEMAEDQLENPLKPVVRLATDEDIEHKHHICRAESQAIVDCRELVGKLNLPMKCLAAEYNLDETHVTVYFSAEGRVDFRELVRELGRRLRVRVELRQVGPRDEAKLLGGFGRCGREFCCASYLSEFAPVSIKMAKEQNLPLNPLKISGVCGRLLCCLGHEYEIYREMNAERATCAGARGGCQTEAAPISRRPVQPLEVKVDPLPVLDEEETTEGVPAADQPGPPKSRRRRRRR
ncbi:regulatory iron-sulfur-containing complex subunit RicT [Dehalogenimonas sp. THU2]|uniref:PSP1 domain-containing protein n=1 Tax=Dehalogenimonas sp. THU2 TaxID=3151121 RepID=UPI0032183E7A